MKRIKKKKQRSHKTKKSGKAAPRLKNLKLDGQSNRDGPAERLKQVASLLSIIRLALDLKRFLLTDDILTVGSNFADTVKDWLLEISQF